MTTIALLPGDGIGGEILDGPVAYRVTAGSYTDTVTVDGDT